jgi:hypothetical protein
MPRSAAADEIFIMSKAEILQELPKLNASELREIQERIWQLEEEELLNGHANPTAEEKELLDRELQDYEREPEIGSNWEDVQSRLKR